MMREPIDLPPIVSVELIEIKDKTYIPFAPKARKIIEKVKEEKKRVVSEQAPPAAKAKEKPDRIPMPEDKKETKELIKKKQNPEEIKPQIISTINNLCKDYTKLIKSQNDKLNCALNAQEYTRAKEKSYLKLTIFYL